MLHSRFKEAQDKAFQGSCTQNWTDQQKSLFTTNKQKMSMSDCLLVLIWLVLVHNVYYIFSQNKEVEQWQLMCFSAAGGNNHQRQQYYANPVISKSCMHLNNRSFHILQCVQYVYVRTVVVGVSARVGENKVEGERGSEREGGREGERHLSVTGRENK